MSDRREPRPDTPWEVRFTWAHGPTVQHPRFTFDRAPTESLAIDRATRELDRMHGGKVLWLIEAHRRRLGDTAWTRVEWTPPG